MKNKRETGWERNRSKCRYRQAIKHKDHRRSYRLQKVTHKIVRFGYGLQPVTVVGESPCVRVTNAVGGLQHGTPHPHNSIIELFCLFVFYLFFFKRKSTFQKQKNVNFTFTFQSIHIRKLGEFTIFEKKNIEFLGCIC